MPDRRLPAVALGLGLVLAVAGCAGPPPPTPAATTVEPRPAFPAVQGRDAQESVGDGVWTLRLRVDDAEAAYRDARRRLVDGGFQLTKDREGTGGGDGQACIRTLCVGFTATEDPDGVATVAYEVFHPLGITTDG